MPATMNEEGKALVAEFYQALADMDVDAFLEIQQDDVVYNVVKAVFDNFERFKRLHPAFANVARELNEGAISGPIRTPLGWHLIRVDGKRDRAVPPLEVVRGLLMRDLSTKIETETLERLRGDAEVERLTSDVPAAAVRADALIED